jgi:hypothetical protein
MASICFYFQPNSGTFGNSNSNSLGKIVMVTNYDPTADSFASSRQAENYDYACSTVPSEGLIHGVECNPVQRSTIQLYTRSGTISKSKIFTDLGLFQLITEGVPFGSGASLGDTALVGELWVTYSLKLSRAKLYQALGEQISHANFSFNVGSDFGAGASTVVADAANHFSMTFTDIDGSNMGVFFPDSLYGKRILVIANINEATNGGLYFTSPVNMTQQDFDLVTASATGAFNVSVYDVGQSTGGIPSFTFNCATAVDTFTLYVAVTIVDPDFRFNSISVVA